MIKGLMVDVDGVLVCGRPSDGKQWSTDLEADLGLAREVLQREFFKPFWSTIVVGRGGLREHLEPVLQRIAPQVTFDTFISYWFENDALVNLKLLEELRQMRLSGTKIYLATNQEHMRAAYLMDKVGLRDHFDGQFYSAEVGSKKPDAEFFATVTALAGLPAVELALIDDTAENVVAARASGWKAVHWTPQSTLSSVLTDLQ